MADEHRDGEAVEGVFCDDVDRGVDDDKIGAGFPGFAECAVERGGGGGFDGGRFFAGTADDTVDEGGQGSRGVASDDDEFEVFGGVAVEEGEKAGLDFFRCWRLFHN